MKNVLTYFVRKAFGFKSTATAEDKTLFGHLLRIRQNIQGVYDWLYGRLSAEHLPRRMPMTEAVVDPNGNMGAEPLRLRPVLQNSDTLLAHLRLLDGRKITNGYADGTPADDGLPDGVSLARLLCDSTLQPTELIDDNIGWVMDKTPTLPSTLTKLVLNCVKATALSISGGRFDLELPYCKEINAKNGVALLWDIDGKEVMEFPELEVITFGSNANSLGSFQLCKVLRMPKLRELKKIGNASAFNANPLLEEIYMPNFIGHTEGYGEWPSAFNNNENLRKVVCGRLSSFANMSTSYGSMFASCPNLLHLEIAEGVSSSMNLWSWSPTLDSSNLSLFLDNFLHFIAERVVEGNYTLTLSAAVYAALEQQEGQTILALLNTKGWTVASA